MTLRQVPARPLARSKGSTQYISKQNIAKTGEWYTPACIFKALGEKLDLDVANSPEGQRHVPIITAENFVSKDNLNEI